MTINFSSIRAVVLDMDGVLWSGSEILPGVPEFFAFLTRQNIPFALATNNSTKTVDTYVEKLNSIGVPARPQDVITSAIATADYISRHYPPGTPVYVIGREGIRQALAERGYPEDPDHAQLVVVGLDFAVTYEKLKTATLRVRGGADFIGTNGDLTFPTPEGLIPGNGSLLAAIQAATDTLPVIIGKPEKAMFETALLRMGTAPEHTLMIGDRMQTDITGAQRAGLRAALVLTGTTTAEQAESSEIPPDGIFESLAAIHAAWEKQIGVSQ
ncbi:MAG: HAD-IIA family hydrolase [Chloroflexi bacterium]|nr:HAD-IIA family hydrolase [Chloroflexota bacterium]